jgi:hypothetical protein
MLVCEACPCERGNGGKDDERRVEEDQTRLSDEGIVWRVLGGALFMPLGSLTKDDETGAQSCGSSTAARSLESQEHGRDCQDTADGGQEAHGDIWHTSLQVVLANVLEIEAAVESTQPARQRDEHLGERRVYVHEEFALDVLGCESTEAGEVVLADASVCVRVSGGRTGPRRRRHYWAEQS